MGSGVCRHVPSRHGTVVHPCVPLQALSALTALSLRSPSHCSLIVSAGALEGVLEAMQAPAGERGGEGGREVKWKGGRVVGREGGR